MNEFKRNEDKVIECPTCGCSVYCSDFTPDYFSMDSRYRGVCKDGHPIIMSSEVFNITWPLKPVFYPTMKQIMNEIPKALNTKQGHYIPYEEYLSEEEKQEWIRENKTKEVE